MLKKTIATTVVFLFALSIVAPAAYAMEKVALVSLQRALNQVNEGKKTKSKLERDYESKKKQIEAEKASFEKKFKDLERESKLLSQDALKKKYQDLQRSYLASQNKWATELQKMKETEASSVNKILASLRDLVTKIAKEKGFTLVIENSSNTVLFAQSAPDITTDVISAYNKGRR